MGWAEILYSGAQRSLAAAEPLLRGSDSKLARGVRARRHAHESLAKWGRASRDAGRPTMWLHAPSVGETLQAAAVLGALRVLRPELQVAFTHFSPSAEGIAERLGAEVTSCLPWDLPDTMAAVLDALEPSLIVFTRSETWPVLGRLAAGRDVPLALIAGTVRPGSRRLAWPARELLAPAWRRLRLAAAVTGTDAVRLGQLGVPAEAIQVTGDPRVDSAAERAAALHAGARHLGPLAREPRLTVVAGSTWPEDEDVLLPALSALRGRVPGLRMVLAPHEPRTERVRDLGERLAAAGWGCSILSSATGEEDALLVDTVGVLADLYSVADAAYVGGGLGRRGLHSVLEPAAAGVPVAFGPRHGHQPAAGDLLAAGGGAVVRDSGELGRVLGAWLTDEEGRRSAGAGALAYIEAHRGAAARTAALLETIILPA